MSNHLDTKYSRNPHATWAALMPAAGTRFGFLHKECIAMFTAPPDPHAWLAPDALRPLVSRQNLSIRFRVRAGDVSWVAIGPLLLLGRVARALGATGVLAIGADGSGSGDE